MHLFQNLELTQQHQTHQRVQHHWLDRLRSSKGFPTGQTPTLDSFLLNINTDNNNNNNNNSSYTRPDNPTRVTTRTRAPTPTTLGSILSQIFNGASFVRTHPNRKCPRKQLHPTRVLPPLSPSPSSSTTTVTVPDVDSFKISLPKPEEERQREEGEEEEEDVNGCGGDEDEAENDGKDLKGFSKSEVTVIDTSSDGWKAVKFVYRKENVWKVKERKRKLRLLAKKKKKSSNIPMANAVVGVNMNEIGFSKENVINMGGKRPTHKLSNLPSQ